MITEDYVSFELAKLLKEKGFDECANCQYPICGIHYGEVGEYNITDRSRNPENYIPASTLQMAMKWLREVYNIHIEIEAIKPHSQDVLLRSAVPIDGVKYHASIVHIDKWNEDLNEFKWKGIPSSDSYEQACEEAIKYCLENLI